MKNIIGIKRNRLTIISNDVKKVGRRFFYLCRCDCGTIKNIRIDSFNNGHAKSCGCLSKEKKTKHGMYGTRINHIWANMRARCNCETNKDYHDYGGRGITVCDEWNDFQVFYEWAIENGYSDDLTIDRTDVNGNYEPSNCRWITNFKQQSNKRNNVKVVIDGQIYTRAQVKRKFKLSDCQFEKRYRKYVI